MKFTPTPEKDTKELKDDLQEFGHKLRLLEHFNDHQQQTDASLVKNKSNFVPPPLTKEISSVMVKHRNKFINTPTTLHCFFASGAIHTESHVDTYTSS